MLKNKITNKAYLAVLVFIFLFIGLGLSVDNKEQKGLVTYVDGSAKKQKLADVQWTNVELNTEVTGGERVRTFVKSRAELELAELDKIRMAPKTTIDILKLYEETKEQQRETQVLLQEGDLWANVAKKSENMSFAIGTPIAAAAITGTTLRMNVAQDSTSELKVYKGEVIITNAPESKDVVPKSIVPYEIEGPHEIPGPREVTLEEWALIVKSMQKVKINNKGQVTSSGNFASTDSDENSDWVRWNLELDKEQK
ncbi:FecR domain-containing protein [candidate division KSB1 bacterium]|nr:FecR domain-containing protein [candidate division KSB1 bacterium]